MDSIAEKKILDDANNFAQELSLNEDKPGKTVDAYKKKKTEEHHRWKTKAYYGMPGSRSSQLKGDDEAANPSEEGEDVFRAKFLSNHTHYSTTDPDARIGVKPRKPRQFNYLGQVIVDTAHHVITHIQAHHADKKDCQCL